MHTPDYDTFQRLLPIQKHELDEELALQAEFLHHISQHLVKAKSRAAQAKDRLEQTEARLYASYKASEGKITVQELHGLVTQNRERIQDFQTHQAALDNLGDWEGMYEAWKARGFALRSLVDLRLSNYYTPDSISKGGDDYSNTRRAIADIRRRNSQPSPGISRRPTRRS